MEDEYLDAMYEDRHECRDDFEYDERDAEYHDDHDDLLERQEMEDFEQTDEYFGCYGED